MAAVAARAGRSNTGTIRHDRHLGVRHLFWCPAGIRRGLALEPNNAAVQQVSRRCPVCFGHWAKGKARPGEAHIYAVWRHSGSRDVYIGTARDVEQRYHGHFTKRSISFLPTIRELEERIRRGDHVPYYEVLDSSSIADNKHLLRERQIASEMKELGFKVKGGR